MLIAAELSDAVSISLRLIVGHLLGHWPRQHHAVERAVVALVSAAGAPPAFEPYHPLMHPLPEPLVIDPDACFVLGNIDRRVIASF